jgi:CubicO group peptidase (beta-lactamase class C family)
MQRDDISRIASMTKPVTSVATMMLAEQGRVSLHEPVSKYLPEFTGTIVGVECSGDSEGKPTLQQVPADRPRTIQDVLRHTGLTYGLFGSSLVKTSYDEAGVFDLRNTNAEMSQKLATLPLAYQPGQVWDYSMATDVLGRVIEVISDKTFGDYFATEIFEPLKMTDTGFVLPRERALRMAQPHADAQGLGGRMTDHTRGRGSGRIGSVFDYCRLS